ncbi:MAG: alpha/beta hydrolase, partial [Povalibacter sp.]
MSLLAFGCSSPGQRIDDLAHAAQLSRRIVEGTHFEHIVYANANALGSNDQRLFVFLDGDGRPWDADGLRPSKDPTTRHPIALQLLMRTQAPAIYISRPCYQQRTQAACSSRLWTQARYSEEVVASIASAIRKIAAERSATNLGLIGYSGGGVLAVLVAERLDGVSSVMTLGANLDVDAWTAEHSYLPLDESLNPARSERTHPWIETHLQGARDTVVPSATTDAYFVRYPAARRQLFATYDHSCCWVDD